MTRLSLFACLVLACGSPAELPVRDGGAPPPDAQPSDAGPPGTDAASPIVDGGLPDPSSFEKVLAFFSDPSVDAETLDTVMHDVAWNEGWPLTDGARWLFVTRWDDAPSPVALVSDINGWDVDAHPAVRAASGVHFYVVVEASAARGAKYKWHGAPDVWRAPPEATAYGYDSYGQFGWVAPPSDQPHLERFPDLRSATLEAPRTLRAYLPAGFTPHSGAAASARVLFLHDGQNVFHPDAPWGGWRVDEALAAPEYRDVVALAVDNAPDRMDAYTHTPDSVGGRLLGGRAEDYVRLIVDEALPFFRARYGVSARGSTLTMAGSSLGGLISAYTALAHPELVGCVIAMSPTLGWGAFRSGAHDALINRWSTKTATSVYLDSGGDGTCFDRDGDGVDEDSDDSDNYCVTVQLRDHLASIGYESGVDLFYGWAAGATHDEAHWAERMPSALAACAAAGW